MNYSKKLETIFEKNIDLDVGDIVKTGKFRNRPAVVKGFGEDDNQPTVKLAKVKDGKEKKTKEQKLLKFKIGSEKS